MSVLGNVINWILGLGAAIFVPIIIIIAGLIVGMKIKDAISAGITLGVAFTGMSMLIGFMSNAIGPAAKAMLTHTGINLPIVDGGWTTLSAIAWSWPYAFLMFPLMIGLNIVMLIINKTKTFNADLWNVWGKIFTGVAVAAVSKPYFGTAASIALAFIVAGIQIIFELKMADMYQYRIEKLSGIPGVTCTHKMGFTSIFMFPIDCILKKIPALNKRFDAAALKDKIGIFAESHVLGFILGIIFGILARYSVAATLTLGIQASCALTLFPVISKYFMMALEPISSAISAFMNKKFEDRTLVVGLDWPFMGGANEIWLAVFWAIPVTLLFSMFLPGNEILPFAGIINNAIAVAAFLVTGGNIIRMLILVTLLKMNQYKVIEVNPLLNAEDVNVIRRNLTNLSYNRRNEHLAKQMEAIHKMPMEELFQKDCCKFNLKISDWKEAVQVAADPLIQYNYIQKEYVDDIIKIIQTIGNYMVFIPEIAFVHAPPEHVNEDHMSLLKLAKPIEFGTKSKVDVKVIIVIASKEENKNLVELMQILMKEDNVAKLKNVTNYDDIREIR